jgi:hypothetical protein
MFGRDYLGQSVRCNTAGARDELLSVARIGFVTKKLAGGDFPLRCDSAAVTAMLETGSSETYSYALHCEIGP